LQLTLALLAQYYPVRPCADYRTINRKAALDKVIDGGELNSRPVTLQQGGVNRPDT
jgi:hypothetical protein